MKRQSTEEIMFTHYSQHGGPFTSKNELGICIQNNKESDIQLKRILRVEISYRKHTSLKDYQSSSLYKINQLSTNCPHAK